MTESVFRGLKGIQDIQEKMERLRDYVQKFCPKATAITLYRKDYDLIKRWPKAGETLGFEYRDDGIYWKGYFLRFDHSPARYGELNLGWGQK